MKREKKAVAPMKRIGMYIVLIICSYWIGVLFFQGMHAILNIPEGSEYHLLYIGINLFYMFFVLPFYFIITFALRFIAKIQSVWIHAILLIGFGLVPSALVPFMGGFGFGYLNAQYFYSEMALLLYAFFTGTAIAFCIGSGWITAKFSRWHT